MDQLMSDIVTVCLMIQIIMQHHGNNLNILHVDINGISRKLITEKFGILKMEVTLGIM